MSRATKKYKWVGKVKPKAKLSLSKAVKTETEFKEFEPRPK